MLPRASNLDRFGTWARRGMERRRGLIWFGLAGWVEVAERGRGSEPTVKEDWASAPRWLGSRSLFPSFLRFAR